jgi:glucosyl-dolichyl phosphate glucuronosyltransferase
MKLNVIIPTYNRAESLSRTLQSILEAEVPTNLEIKVAVIDNNSSDNTKNTVERFIPQFTKIKLEYIFEERQGKSFAFNTGVLQSDGELFSGIDDDIEIAKDWFIELDKVFRKHWDTIDFVGGKMLPNWEISPPSWIKPLKDGVISWRDYGDDEWTYTLKTPILTGGHSAFKREIFDEIGLLPEKIGPTGKNLIGCEDDVFFHMLMKAKKKGIYCPKLVFYHYVPAYRLSKSYYRQWCFGSGVSKYLMDKHFEPIEGARILDIPRWMYRNLVISVYEKIKYSFFGNEEDSLAKENPILQFSGFFYARHIKDSWLDKPLQSVMNKLIKTAER